MVNCWDCFFSIHVPFAFSLPKTELKSQSRQAYKRDKQGPQQSTEVVKKTKTKLPPPQSQQGTLLRQPNELR